MKTAKLWKLFVSTLYISAFTFGGGFVIVSMMKKRFTDSLHWIDEDEILDMTAVAQSSPGATTVNAAIMLGWKIGGALGMVLAVAGSVLPPMVILSVISLFYEAFAANRYIALTLSGMQAGVAAVIMDIVCNLGVTVIHSRSVLNISVMVLAFAVSYFLNINVVFIILTGVLISIVRELIKHKRRKYDIF